MKRIDLTNYEAYLLDYYDGNLNNELTLELKKFAEMHPELGIEFDLEDLPKIEPISSKFELKNSLKKEVQDVENEKVISFLEGLLSSAEIKDFENDLRSDNEIKILLNKYKQTYFSENTEYIKLDKNLLHIHDFFNNQKLIFDYMEGNLTDTEKLNFEDKLLDNYFIQNQLNAYLATKLIPKNEYFDKEFLYKTDDDLIISNKAILALEGAVSEQSLTNYEEKELAIYKKTISKPDLTVIYPFKNELKKQPTKVISLFTNTKFWSAAATLVFAFGFLVLFLKDDNINDGRAFEKTRYKKRPALENNFSNKAMISSSNLASKESRKKNELFAQINKSKRFSSFLEKDTTTNNSDSQLAIANPTIEAIRTNTPSGTLTNVGSRSESSNFTEEKTEAILVLNEERDNESDTDDISIPVTKVKKSNFWSKAVKLAANLNGLGIKSLKAKDLNNEYIIAYNSFGIEKK